MTLALEVGTTNFLFYAASNLAHWAFGFKYWVISRETPKALRLGPSLIRQDLEQAETFYRRLNFAGIFINVLFCLTAGILRGMISYNTVDEHAVHKDFVTVTITIKYCVTILQLISGLFLAKAL